MSDPAFDTLGAARKLKDAGVGADQAEAIVEVMGESTNQLVTTERFETGISMLHTQLTSRIDSLQTELRTGFDALRAEMGEKIARSQVATISIMIAANALMFAMFGVIYGMLQVRGVIP